MDRCVCVYLDVVVYYCIPWSRGLQTEVATSSLVSRGPVTARAPGERDTGEMQGLLGACACSQCPGQPSRAVVPPDKLKAVVKALGEGAVSFDAFGAFTMGEQIIDLNCRPGKRDLGLDAVIVTLSTEAITLVHPKLYENGMVLLKDYYSHKKLTRENLERARVAPAEGAIPLTFYDVLAWQIMKGPQRAADIAITLTRSLCRDSKAAARMSCLLWKRDKKSKGYLAVTALIQRLASKKESRSLQVCALPPRAACRASASYKAHSRASRRIAFGSLHAWVRIAKASFGWR
jgi:hypothetical protein